MIKEILFNFIKAYYECPDSTKRDEAIEMAVKEIEDNFISKKEMNDLLEKEIYKQGDLRRHQKKVLKKTLTEKVKINKEANKEDNMISLTGRLYKNNVYCEVLKIIKDL